MANVTKSDIKRIDLRVSAERKAVLERAALMRDTSLTQFVLSAALEKAEQIHIADQVIRLSKRDAKVFADVVNQTVPPQALVNAFVEAASFEEKPNKHNSADAD